MLLGWGTSDIDDCDEEKELGESDGERLRREDDKTGGGRGGRKRKDAAHSHLPRVGPLNSITYFTGKP